MEERTGFTSNRLGTLLTLKKKLSDDQLQNALHTQETYRRVSVPSRLGEVLVESSTCPATVVSEALHRQRDSQVKSNTIGQLLVELGHVTEAQLDEMMETHLDVLAPLGEILVDREICSNKQIQNALHLQLLRRIAAVRRPLASSFDPINVMEVLVEESIDNIIHEQKGCDCDQCRSNIIALSLNGLAPRYISDMEMLVNHLDRFRDEYGVLVQARIQKAAEQVREHPKLSCKNMAQPEKGDVLGTTKVCISNRHVHLSTEHLEQLFGTGYALTKWKDLLQPGQYAAKETVTLKGPKGTVERVRVLGPSRRESQVEISGTDQFKLGVYAPVRESGQLKNTPGICIVGTSGQVSLKRGVIRAWRHIHMTPEDGLRFRVRNRDRVQVRLKGDRATVLEHVLIRITDSSALEMHVDTDEANAAGVTQESEGDVLAAS